MQFTLVPRNQRVPAQGIDHAYLWIDHWNDYRFVTMFNITLFDEFGQIHELGDTKIGFVGQTTATDTYATLRTTFPGLGDQYFSLGTDVEYYRALSNVSPSCRVNFLRGLRDIVDDEQAMGQASGQEVFKTSLLRYVSISVVTEQYKRVLGGDAPLTNFRFDYVRPQSDRFAEIALNFAVTAGSKPSTNIHAIIGRNGVGKTTLLNDMISLIMQGTVTLGGFSTTGPFQMTTPLSPVYFSSLVSVSFSAFDPFTPPLEQTDPERGTRYSYIGLKDPADPLGKLKSLQALRSECLNSLNECFADTRKRARWLKAIRTLESDDNFAQMELPTLADYNDTDRQRTGEWLVSNMSAGHALVLLTVSKLVARVEEKTLVLLDEPESHLHPPLLSAFTRALSELLHNRNGVAIVATHSPVVLQEVPRSCVTVITRARLALSAQRPTIETFGENVGVLTREVFGLEVSKSGFHSLLEIDSLQGSDYEAILAEYSGQLGQEARGILRAMLSTPKSDLSRS